MDSERFKDVVEKVMSAIIEGRKGNDTNGNGLGSRFKVIIDDIIPAEFLKTSSLKSIIDRDLNGNEAVLRICERMLTTRKSVMSLVSQAGDYEFRANFENLYNCLEMFIPVLRACVEDSDEFYEIIRVCLMGLSASLKNYENKGGDDSTYTGALKMNVDNTYKLFMAIARIIDGMNASKRRFVESAHSLPNNSLEWQAIHRIVTILHTSSQ
jgi:hypothetical protein